jgi:hypothetical protein
VGQPYNASKADQTNLPATVDHTSRMTPVRNQGKRPDGLAFAFAAALEGAYKSGHLAVEPLAKMGTQIQQQWSNIRTAEEHFWPLGKTQQPGFAQAARFGIKRLISTGTGSEKLKQILADRPENNIIMVCLWDMTLLSQNGVFKRPAMPQSKVQAQIASCKNRADCGLHAMLLVGYAPRTDSDNKQRAFFKFKNSWGNTFGQNGYGYMSGEYVRQFCQWGGLITEVLPATPGQTNPYSQGPSAVGKCGGVSFVGCCSGKTLTYCEENELKQVRCTQSCGWSTQKGLYDCGGDGPAPSEVGVPLVCPSK